MNSKQRRRAKRYWRYVVDLEYHSDWHLDVQRRQWCTENIGPQGYDWYSFGYGTEYQFHNPKHAAWFKLKWS